MSVALHVALHCGPLLRAYVKLILMTIQEGQTCPYLWVYDIKFTRTSMKMKSEVVSFRQNPGNGQREKTGEGQQVAVPCYAMRSTLGQRDVFDAYHVTFAFALVSPIGSGSPMQAWAEAVHIPACPRPMQCNQIRYILCRLCGVPSYLSQSERRRREAEQLLGVLCRRRKTFLP